MCLSHHQLVLRWNDTVHDLTNSIRAKIISSSHGSVIVREGFLGNHNLTLYNYSKNRLVGRNDEWHRRFKCVFLIVNWFWGGITQLMIRQIVSEPRSLVWVIRVSLWGRDFWETIIWLLTITLKIGLWEKIWVSSSSPIGFEVEWQNSWSDKQYQS